MPTGLTGLYKHDSKAGRRNAKRPELNMARLALEAGISAGHLTNVLKGRCQASIEVAVRLARKLGLTVEELRSEIIKGRF